MGALLEDFKNELSLRQSRPGFDKEAFKTQFLKSRGHKRKPVTTQLPENGKGLPPSRPGVTGTVKDVLSSVVRGVVTGIPEQALQIVRTIDQPGGVTDVFREAADRGLEGLERIGEETKFLRRSKESEKGFRSLLTQAAEATPLSLAARAPGAIAGGILGQLAIPIPGVGAVIGTIVGAGLSGGALFGLANFSQTQDEIDDAIANDTTLTDEQKAKLAKFKNVTALGSASAEAGFEFLSGMLTMATAGLFNKVPGLKSGLKNTVRGLLTKQKGAVASALAATAIGEGGTEAATAAVQLKLRKDLGIADVNIFDKSVEAFGVGALVGLFFGGGLQIAGSLQRRNIKNALSNANTGRITREKAVEDIASGIKGRGKNSAANAIADSFKTNALSFIERGKPVSLDTDLGTIKQIEDIAEALLKQEITIDQAMQLRPMIAGRPELLDRFDDVVAIASRIQDAQGIKPTGTVEDVTEEGSDAADIVLDPNRDVDLEAVLAEEEGIADLQEDIKVDISADIEKREKPSELKAIPEKGETELPDAIGETVITEAATKDLVTELEDLRSQVEKAEGSLFEVDIRNIEAELNRRGKEIVKKEKRKEEPKVPVVKAGEGEVAKEKVDEAAGQTDATPSQAEIEAGNAKKGHVKVQGLDISIETAKGQERSGTDVSGKPFSVVMKSHYGYIKKTEGKDGDQVDVFIGDNPGSENVFVVNQIVPETGKFDEHKVMIGFDTKETARKGYLENYAKGWQGLKSIAPMSMTEFKEWIKGDTTKEFKPSVSEAAVPEVVVPSTTKPGKISAIEKEIEVISDADLDALLDTSEGTTEPTEPKTIEETAKALTKERGAKIPKPIEQKTAGDIISEAARSGVKGIDSALKGIHELFGGSALRSFPGGLDKETYAKAKPHFQTAFKEFISTGKSLKEFFEFMIQRFSPKIKPYLKQFVVEQRKGVETEKPVTPEEPVKVDVGEPKAKPKKPKTENKEKLPPKPKRIRLRDVGEEMFGKRSQKDNFERIKEEIKELSTGNTNKDLNRILNRAVRSKLWPIEKADRPNATPGTIRYLKMVRDSAMGVTSYTAGKLGGFEGTSKARLEEYAGIEEAPGDNKGFNEIADYVAKYENGIELLNAVTATANTVKEAHDNIVRLVGNETAIGAIEKNQQLSVTAYLSDTGTDVMDIFSWQDERKVFRIQKFTEEEHSDKPEPKQLRRTRVSIEELDRENVSDHRKDKPNPTPEDFQTTFGFRGVEFGEYVDSKSGRRHINLAFDSFHDLTDVLGVTVKAAGIISGVGATGRHLGMAFGSRGRGRHVAHYEPGNHVINMTKNNSDGSLSHEWGHSLDHAVSATNAGRNAIQDVKNALEVKYDIAAAKAQVEEILTGNSYWTNRTKRTPVEVAREFLERKWEIYVEKPTKFTREARELDPQGTYWNQPEEKFARAFEAFIYDSLEGSSPYLVTDWVNGDTTTPENGYRGNPYPQGEEREQFNRIFKHFMDSIEWSKDGRPTMKADYELVTEKERKAAKVEMKKLMDKLEEMFAAIHQGKPSKDGLWWYKYTATKRANLMQPKGFNAFDDKFKAEDTEGEGAVGYTEALLPDDILYYKLKDIVHDDDTNKVYLKEKSDAKDIEQGGLLDTAGLEGESSLGEAQAEDGGGTETGAGVSSSVDERPGEITDSPSEPGESGGSRPPGLGGGAADVDTPTGGTGKPEIKPGQDAVLGGGNYRITESDRVGQGSINEKFTNNIAAIRTLKLIEKEARDATREEQAVLVKYVGWGGMSKAFDEWDGWGDKFEILKEALTKEEYAAARASTLSSFYTSPEIVDSIYVALQKMGFKGGRILEPAVGTGNFFGLLPEVLAQDTQLAGVELDGISARITRQLYQRATIFHNAYEKVNLPRGFYDVALSNVPFEETIPFDKKYNTKRFKLHDYYFAKTLELVRPGGIIGFITSAGTMDKLGDKARKLMREKADFVGAIRLPDTSFKDAGTKVTADIIFLRRKGGDGKAIPENKFVEIKEFTHTQPGPDRPKETYNINEYFVKHPEMMLGKMSLSGRWDDSQSLINDGRDIEKALAGAVDKLPADIYEESKSTVEIDIADLIPNVEDLIDGSYFEESGKLLTHIPGKEAVEYLETTPFQRNRGKIIRSFIKLRGIRRQLLKSQAKEEAEDIIQKHTKALNEDYDAFVKKHGFINETANLRAIIEDPEAPRILALENWNEETEEATKSDIFSKKFIQNLRPVTSVDKPADAIPHSLNAIGRVDIPFIAKLSGVSEEETIKELQGEIWNDPEQGWVISDEYLAGNIKQKIALAEQASLTDPSFKKNVEALTPLIPPDLPPSKISANLGAPWIEPKDVQGFIRQLIPSAWHIHVDYIQELGKWVFTPRATSDAESKRQHKQSKESVAATATWGTSRKNFFDLLDNILNGGLPTVRDKIPGTNPPQYQLNPKETDAAQAKLDAIKERFSKWIWENDKRVEKYVRKYNDVYNAVRQRTWNGDHLTFPGKVPDDIIKLTKHQKDAVWRAISSGLNTYFAHEVGTGKTYVMAATVIEAKRLGLKKKPLILGIKANVDELAENFAKLYPAARILRLDVSGNALTRKIQLNRIANNEWDAVIISHDSFKNIQLSPEGQSAAMEEELGSLRIALALAQEQGAAKFTIKQIEKKVKALEGKQEELQASLNESKIDLDFEELGVDMIVVDEAHIFKNIPYATAHSNIVGISADGSSRAFDLHMKTRWINEKYGGGIILASGTPITNSVAEIFNIGRYLNPQSLRDKGIHTFDAWAAAFGNITQTPEFAPEGGGYRMVRKFKEFVNIPELRAIVREVVDVVSVSDLNLKVPDILHGKPKAIVVPQNPMVEALGQEMLIRAQDIRAGGVNTQPRHPDTPDIMLTVISDGRNGAIDMRLVDPALPDHPDTKANVAVNNIFQIWKSSENIKATQLIFADRGVPSKGKTFNVYDDIRDKLVEMGIPAEQIKFPRDVKKNKLKKRRLFNLVNSGEVRILIGSTADMGVGVNVQERGVAIHNMDTEWTFEKLEQRRGRFIRQGNIMIGLDLPVTVFNYATEGTVDAFMWDKVAAKKITTEVVLFGNSEVRTVEDVSQEGMSAQEMMAMASGDPRFLHKIELEAEVRKLNAVRGNWVDEQYRLKRELGGIPGVIEAMQTGIAHREQGLKFFKDVNAVKIGDVLYDLKKHSKELGERMAQVLSPDNVKKVHKSPNNIPIATFGNAITKEVEGEEVTTVKTAKDIHALKKGEKIISKTRKINKVLEWNGNDISVYVRSPFAFFKQGELGADKKKGIDNLKIGTKTKYGEFEMTASGGLARLLANTKAAMERQTKESKEIIEKKEKEKEDILKVIDKPFEQEKEHTEKTLELKTLTQELGVVLEQQQEQRGRINPDLERFKSQATDVTTEDDINLQDDDVALSLGQKQKIRKDEKEWWVLSEAIGRAVANNNLKEKEVLEKRLAGVNARLSKQNDVSAKKPGTGKIPVTGVLADVYADLFNEAESILGRGKVDLEIVSKAELLKAPGVLEAARKRVSGLTEVLNIKGAYFGVTVDGVAARGVIKIAVDRVANIPDMKTTARHEVFHGVFRRLLNDKDRKIILSRYGSEEKAADAFAEYINNKGRLLPNSVKSVFERLIEFFERFGQLLRGRGFKSAGDIFGQAASGELVDKASTNKEAGVDIALSIEKGVPEEDLNAEHETARKDFRKALESDDPIVRQYAEGLRNVITQNPMNVMGNHSRTALVDEIYAGATNKDIKFTQRVFGLPWFLAKKFTEWKQALGIELKRSEDRNLLISEFNKRVGVLPEGVKNQHEIMALKRSEEEGVLMAIYEGDAGNTEISEKKLRNGFQLDFLGQLDKKYRDETFKLNDAQVAAYKAWQKSMKDMRERVLDAIDKLTYLPWQGKPWVEKLKSVVKRHELQRDRQREVETDQGKRTDFSELSEKDIPQRMKEEDVKEFIAAFNKVLPKQIRISTLRRKMGELQGYAPRVRQGKYVVRAYDNEGNTLWHERTEKEKETRGMITDMISRFEAEGFTHGADFIVRKEISDKASEFIFDQIQAVSVERFINKALNQAKTNEKISEADIEAVSEEMITLLTNEFKQRGFASHMMKRRRGFPIGGYKIENIKKRYAEYVSGSAGYITKQVAAYEYANLLRTIDINSKPDLYEDIAKYSGDMLRNQTRLDRISGRVRTAAFVWYLAGQLKSPVVNFTQNWILGIPLLEKTLGRGAKGAYHRAMYDVARRKYTDQERTFMKEMQERGITGDQLTQEIMGATQAEAGKVYETTIKTLGLPFSLSEIYNRKVSALARFRTAIEQGDSYREAFDKSRDFVIDVHFLYGKLNAPSGARGGTPGAAILRTSLTFRNYTFNFLHAMKDLLSERDFKTVAKSMAYMALLGGLSSLPFLDGFLDMLERNFGWAIRNDVKKELEAGGGEILANVGIQGLPALIGADIGGSLRIHFPDITSPGKLIEESVFGVYEGLALKAVNSIKAAMSGQTVRAFEIAAPVFIERPLKAIRESRAGLTTTRGKIIKEPTGRQITPTLTDSVITGLGFRASRLARLSDNYRQFKNISKFYADWRNDIYTSFRLAKTFEARQAVIEEVMQYNRASTDEGGAISLIRAAQLKNALKNRIDKRFLAFSQ